MKVLVLGSDGQIGRPLTTYLREQGDGVVEFDNYSNPVTDLRIPGILDYLLPEIDFVFFLAFDVGGSIYLKQHQNTYEFISNNIKIMNNTFDSLRKSGTQFIFASSQMAEMSHSTYGILKLTGEKYTNCLNGKILKFWNVYGVNDTTEKAHVITDFISMARSHNRIDMKTDGTESRQFLYAKDCSKCLSIVMNRFD
ncbi:MAG: NAD-dependent epimerase/dehydratase family protein, partial [Dehalococcoidia bacterium]